jgi:hypothetical protein
MPSFDYGNPADPPEPIPGHVGQLVGAFAQRVVCQTCGVIALPDRKLRAYLSDDYSHVYPFDGEPARTQGMDERVWNRVIAAAKAESEAVPSPGRAVPSPGGALPSQDGPSEAIDPAPRKDAPQVHSTWRARPEPDPKAIRAQVAASDAKLRALAADAPDSPMRLEYLAKQRAQREAMGIAEYPNRSKMHGEARKQLPSRSKEARRLEARRRRARQRGQQVALTGWERQVLAKALLKIDDPEMREALQIAHHLPDLSRPSAE